jgi:hypothetical protein
LRAYATLNLGVKERTHHERLFQLLGPLAVGSIQVLAVKPRGGVSVHVHFRSFLFPSTSTLHSALSTPCFYIPCPFYQLLFQLPTSCSLRLLRYPDKTSGDKTSGAIKRPVTKRLSLNVWSYKTSGVKTSGATKCPELQNVRYQNAF